MKQLTCEMCGSTELVKRDGVFVCQTCGTKYSVEEAKKMMIEGTVAVEGKVSIDDSQKISVTLDNTFILLKSACDEYGNPNYDKIRCLSEKFDKIIDSAPSNPYAHLGKLLCSLGETQIEALSLYRKSDLENNTNYQFVLKFADQNLKDRIEQYLNSNINLDYELKRNNGRLSRKLCNKAFEKTSESITIPNGVKVIEDSAFEDFHFTNITIPNGVELICQYAFRNCTSLTNITIPESVHIIDKYAFENCTSLTNITIPEGEEDNNLKIIGDYAFSMCYSLKKIDLSNATSIGEHAFFSCRNLTAVILPKDGSVENRAFYNCKNIEEIYIEDSIQPIQIKHFSDPYDAVLYHGFDFIDFKEYICERFDSDNLKKITMSEKLCSECFGDGLNNDRMWELFEEITNDFLLRFESLKEILVVDEDRNRIDSIFEYVDDPRIESAPASPPTPTAAPKSTGCYVATCVYGSYDCPQVWTLRRYRDDTLGSTWYGRLFIRTYYAISPTLVKWFGNTNWFKKLWKGKLDRMVAKLQANGVENTPYQDKNW